MACQLSCCLGSKLALPRSAVTPVGRRLAAGTDAPWLVSAVAPGAASPAAWRGSEALGGAGRSSSPESGRGRAHQGPGRGGKKQPGAGRTQPGTALRDPRLWVTPGSRRGEDPESPAFMSGGTGVQERRNQVVEPARQPPPDPTLRVTPGPAGSPASALRAALAREGPSRW